MSHLKNLWVAMLTRNTGYAGTSLSFVQSEAESWKSA